MDKLVKVFKKWYFYVYFVLCTGIFLALFEGTTFSWFGLWSKSQNDKVGAEYIKKSLVDDAQIGSVFANLKLGNSNYSNINIIGKSIELMGQSNNLISIDVIGLLDSSVNKPLILESHVNQLEKMEIRIENTLGVLDGMILEYKTQHSQCSQAKEISDRIFNDGVNNLDSDMALEGLNMSLSNGKCKEINRIPSRAYGLIYNRLKYNQDLIKRKYDVIINNQDLIRQNFQMFRDSSLENLIQIRNELQQYNGTNY